MDSNDICTVCSRDVDQRRISSRKHNCESDIGKAENAQSIGNGRELLFVLANIPGIVRSCRVVD